MKNHLNLFGSSKIKKWSFILLVIIISLPIIILSAVVIREKNKAFKDAKIIAGKETFRSYEAPKFKVYINEGDLSFNFFQAYAQEKPKIEAKIIDSLNNETDLKTEITEESAGVYEVSVVPVLAYRPGKYTLATTISSSEGERTITQDFSWGVLAMNPNKAVYSPGETAKIMIGILDNKGKMDCSADVTLKIQSPKNETITFTSKKGDIKIHEVCKSYDFTLEPDYSTSFTVDEMGEYKLTLTATTDSGTHTIEDYIKVSADIPFDIERISATRIYPYNIYPMNIEITANEDFSGKVIEEVPAGFAIEESHRDKLETDYAAVTNTLSNKETITWSVNWKKGGKYLLSYSYDAPDISPQFYLSGNLQLINSESKTQYSEGRFWQIAGDNISDKVVIASAPASAISLTSEQIGGTDAHVIQINSPGETPSYRYQFLTNGVRIMIDKKDGNGLQQAVSQIRTAPEYMKQQGPAGNFVWNSYGLNVNTSGSNVLQGFDRQNQPDGSTKLVRTYSTFEEGTSETLTETWAIPASIIDFAQKGPKVTYSMTKNRGIINTNGVAEGTWRMRWQISGISDITGNSSDIKDASNWPLRSKKYLNDLIEVNIDDFDNQFSTPKHSYSEASTNNKAEILFFKDGTTGDRVIDPTVVTSNIAIPWRDSEENLIYYNGSYFFVFYTKGSNTIYVKAASTISGLSSAGEQTVVTNQDSAGGYGVGWVNDSKFDVAVQTSGDTNTIAKTCTVSGSTVSCGSDSSTFDSSSPGVHAVRTPSANRIWLGGDHTGFAGQTGDASGVSSWTDISNMDDPNMAAAFSGSDRIMKISFADNGGTNNDFIRTEDCTTSGCSLDDVSQRDNPTEAEFGTLIRVSDSDFRMVYINNNSDVIEAKYNGSSWTATHATVHTGTDHSPAIFYDRVVNIGYAVWVDSNDDIWYSSKTCMSGSGCSEGSWSGAVDADNNEGDANSAPVVAQHEPADGSSRTSPLEFSYCYLNANSSNFDVVCSSVNLASAGISVTGNVYNAGTSNALTECDASAATFELRLRVGGATYSASCSSSDGSFSFTSVTQPSGGDGMVIWIDGAEAPETDGALVVRYDGSGDSTSNIFYDDTVTVTSDDTTGADILDFNTYDNADDSDIPYTAADANPDTLSVNSGFELLVKIKSGVAGGSTVFDPNGTVTTDTTGGDFHIDDNSRAYLDTSTNSIGRDIVVDAGATLNFEGSTTVTDDIITNSTGVIGHTANSPVVTVSGATIGGGSGNITFYRLQKAGAGTTTFSGSGTNTINNTLDATNGTFTLAPSNVITVSGNVSASNSATLNQNASLTINGGSLLTIGTGAVNTTGGTGTVTLTGTGNIGGGGTVTVYNLTIGGTQTLQSATTTNNNLSVSTGSTLGLNNLNFNSAGSFATSGTGTITCSGCTAGTVTLSGTGNIGGGGTVTVYNLTKSTGGTNTLSSATSVLNDLNVSAGTLNGSSDLIVGSTSITNSGDISVAGTLSLSSNSTTTVRSSSAGSATIGGAGSITFYNLSIFPTAASAPTITLGSAASQTINVSNDLIIGNGSNGATVTANTNNPNINVDGSFSISTNGGVFTAPGSANFTIAKNFTNNGTFNNNSGEITFDTTNSSVFDGSGTPAIQFNDFTVTTQNKTLSFTQGKTFRIDGIFTVTGTSNNEVNIVSTTATQWLINLQGSASVTYADIINSGCAGGTNTITLDATNHDGGNNDICWNFTDESTQPSASIEGGVSIYGGTTIR